jgi:hypothetical protein
MRRVPTALSVLLLQAKRSHQRLLQLAARAKGHDRSRLTILAAFCEAHTQKIEGRLVHHGVPMRLVLREQPLPESLVAALRDEAVDADIAARSLEQVAKQARADNDPATSWVCELSRTEEEERAVELRQMADRIEQETKAA